MNKILVIFTLLIISNITYANQKIDFKYKLPIYSYHQFANGFELLLVENHTNPLIATVVVVRTGLRNETPVNNGVSHMLEHMTFNGTEKRTQKQLYDELDFYGVYLNAQTSEDYTTFMALNHKDQALKTLDILSDMLFHSSFPAKKFEKEKGIIVEEIRKDSEDPDFKKQVALRKAFYSHPPYSMPVIGTTESVRKMTREQVLQYYQTYYSPNNMIAIVIGDFSQEDMLQQMKNYFGTIPMKQIPKKQFKLDQKFPFIYSEKNDKKEQTIYVKFPAPTFHSQNYIPFQFVYSSEFDGENSRITKALKANKKFNIKKIQSEYEYHPEFAVLTLKITTSPGVKTGDILKAVTDEIEAMKRTDISSQEISALKRREAISEILQTEKILYYGFLKAQALAVGGRAAFEKTIPAMLNTKIETINNFLHTYPLKVKSPEKLFTKSNWRDKVKLETFGQKKSRIQSRESKIYRHVFKNGLTVIHLHNEDNSVLAMHLLFKNRSAMEPEGKTGIADFLHHSLFKSSKNYPKADLEFILKNIGAEIKAFDWDFIPYDDYYNVPDYSYIRFVTLDQFFNQAMPIIADNVIHPEIDSVFVETKTQMQQLAARSQNNARKVAQLGFSKLLFGADHPLSKPVSGTPASIEQITPDDLIKFHQKYFSTGNTIISIVSSLDSSTVFNAVQKYFSEMPESNAQITIPDIPLTTEIRVDSVRAGSQQSYINLGYVFNSNTSDATALQLMNSMLSDQIAFSLREQKGWAYRVGSRINGQNNHFYLSVTMGTGRQTTFPAISGIIEEIKKFKKSDISESQLIKTQNSKIAALARRRASRENQAFVLGTNEFYGHSPSYFTAIYDKIRNITVDSIIAVRNKYIQSDKYILFYTIPSEKTEKSKNMMRMPPNMKH